MNQNTCPQRIYIIVKERVKKINALLSNKGQVLIYSKKNTLGRVKQTRLWRLVGQGGQWAFFYKRMSKKIFLLWHLSREPKGLREQAAWIYRRAPQNQSTKAPQYSMPTSSNYNWVLHNHHYVMVIWQLKRNKNLKSSVLIIWKSDIAFYVTLKNLVQTYLLYQLDTIIPFKWLDSHTSPIDKLS